MKTSAIASAILVAAAAAQPHVHGRHARRHGHGPLHERAVVTMTEWFTATQTYVQVIDVSTTYMITESSTSSVASTTTTSSSTTLETTTSAAPTTTTSSTTTSLSTSSSSSTSVVPPESSTTAPLLNLNRLGINRHSSSSQAPPPPSSSPAPVVVPSPSPSPSTPAGEISMTVEAFNPPVPTTPILIIPTPTPTPIVVPTPTPTPVSGGGGSGSGGKQVFHGDATWYNIGVGSCGRNDTGLDNNIRVVAIDWEQMGAESNNNPLCLKYITIEAGGRQTTAQIVDKCMGCEYGSIDLSELAFLDLFLDLGVGRDKVDWWFN